MEAEPIHPIASIGTGSCEVRKMSDPDRTTLLARGHPTLSIRRQCGLLGLARSGVYRPGRIANDDELAIMRRLDELFLAQSSLGPFFGSRRMTAMLRAEGWVINRKRGSSSPTGR